MRCASTPNRVLRAQALRVFDRTFAVTQALRLLAVIVAFIGVWSALMALQIERTRELATLQALGLTHGQLARLALMESGLMGLIGGPALASHRAAARADPGRRDQRALLRLDHAPADSIPPSSSRRWASACSPRSSPPCIRCCGWGGWRSPPR